MSANPSSSADAPGDRRPGGGRLPGAAALAAAVSHVLRQHEWARDRLAPHAGRHVLLGLARSAEADRADRDGGPPAGASHMPSATALLTVQADGTLAVASTEITEADAAAVMLLRPSFDAALDGLFGGTSALSRHLQIDGDVLLAGALGEIARHARWDVAEDLGKVVGDVAARRLTDLASVLRNSVRTFAGRAGQQATRFVSEESGLVVGRAEMDAFEAQLGSLESRCAALEAGRVASGAVGPADTAGADDTAAVPDSPYAAPATELPSSVPPLPERN